MSDPIKRTETTYVDEVTRTGSGSVQWFLENRNKQSSKTHPITFNNKLEVFICGQLAFADIAEEIRKAQQSIDLCCWGFDPGMELERSNFPAWPRGPTFGDLLIDAGKRGVTVRLLVWFDWKAKRAMKNMPGYSHGTRPWLRNEDPERDKFLCVTRSLAMAQTFNQSQSEFAKHYGRKGYSIDGRRFPMGHANVHLAAREEYCFNWYKAAFAGNLKNIHVRTRKGTPDGIGIMLNREKIQPDGVADGGTERAIMVHGGTHHQKPVLIDFAFESGRKAVGYVMGLNSVTDYWDTSEHKLEDQRREQGGSAEAEECVIGKSAPGFRSRKPYHDYACKISVGGALLCLNKNFQSAWDRARPSGHLPDTYSSYQSSLPPECLTRAPEAGDSAVQILRTQPEEDDQTIKELYFNAADKAAAAVGYVYIENQYFQYEEWVQRLMATRKKVVAKWKTGAGKARRGAEEMPLMYVLIVVPVPERAEMVPRTYDALAGLGQQRAMAEQQAMIDNVNRGHILVRARTPDFLRSAVDTALPSVVEHANTIHKPTLEELEQTFGTSVCVAMLNTCDLIKNAWQYREIYNHSKLMIVDDGFCTLGSANLNQRSMAVDSEINIATDDTTLARDLRRRIWHLHAGKAQGADGGSGSRSEVRTAFTTWKTVMYENRARREEDSEVEELKKLVGFLLPLEDNRSSFFRLG